VSARAVAGRGSRVESTSAIFTKGVGSCCVDMVVGSVAPLSLIEGGVLAGMAY
jgi:hypothetical protein